MEAAGALPDARTCSTDMLCPLDRRSVTMQPEENKALARRIPEEVWSRGDMDAADTVLAPDFVNHNPAFGHAPTREGYKQTVAEFRGGFPDFVMSVEDVVAEDDKVVLRFRARGTQTGTFAGFLPSGRPIEFTGTGTCRVSSNGQIAELWVNGDLLGLMQQLGATISPPAVPVQE
jgi:steroid delta-isomerase-like uncharacterized protein